jgi:hypothetical protein
VTDAPDLFASVPPETCGECAYCIKEMHGSGRYCDWSKKDASPEGQACPDGQKKEH